MRVPLTNIFLLHTANIPRTACIQLKNLLFLLQLNKKKCSVGTSKNYMSWPSHVGATCTIETMCSLLSCTERKKPSGLKGHLEAVNSASDGLMCLHTGDCVRWAGPGGQAGPDDLHLPADDQVYLPQVRHQRGGQQRQYNNNIGLYSILVKSKGLQRNVVYLGWPIAP